MSALNHFTVPVAIFEKPPKYKAEIEVAELLGHESILYTTLAGQQLVAKVDARSDVRMGDTLELALDMNKCHFFDVTTEEVIR